MQQLLAQAIKIAILAGQATEQYYHQEIQYQLKEDLSPITQADLASNEIILKELQKISPFPVCTEESPISIQERKSQAYYWLVDPLDGTKDFIAKTNHFTVNIALMQSDQDLPIFGIIYAPILKKLMCGGKDFGLFKLYSSEIDDFLKEPQWEKLKQPNIFCPSPNRSLLGCGSHFHQTKESDAYFQHFNLKKYPIGSSLKFCALALGLIDLYPRYNGTKEWDTAAGDAILRSVGGFLIDVETKEVLKYGKEDFKNPFFIAFAPRLKECYCDFLLK